ncbi:MAG: hypothetical protein WCL14_00535 [Bacteroidota bacterium]
MSYELEEHLVGLMDGLGEWGSWIIGDVTDELWRRLLPFFVSLHH